VIIDLIACVCMGIHRGADDNMDWQKRAVEQLPWWREGRVGQAQGAKIARGRGSQQAGSTRDFTLFSNETHTLLRTKDM
jgi:hypothetical protein